MGQRSQTKSWLEPKAHLPFPRPMEDWRAYGVLLLAVPQLQLALQSLPDPDRSLVWPRRLHGPLDAQLDHPCGGRIGAGIHRGIVNTRVCTLYAMPQALFQI